jgi:cyclic beta-1,2-glucan synthetase
LSFPYFNYYFGIGVVLLLVLLLRLVLHRVRKNRNINIRDASLTVEELEDHARRTALEHYVSSKRNMLNWPLSRMNDNYSFILLVYKGLNDDIMQKRTVPPAAEWLLDNFYVIEEQVKSIRRDLSKKNYYSLPVLKKGPFKGYTRIFAIAMELVAHMDGQIEESTLLKYLEAYQSHNILFEREICVIPTMIRLALIENIRIISEKIEETQKQWNIADEIVKRWWSEDAVDLGKIIKLFKNNIAAIDEANPSFVEHLFYRLRRSGRSYTNVLKYIDENLYKFDTTTEIIAQKEHNTQAVSTVSMGNCIISLKYVSSLNWVDLFESASFLEKILRQDPDGTYILMDINSRNYYRNQIEKLAKAYRVSELHIAREAIGLAQKASLENNKETDDENKYRRRSHVGYYLVGNGVKRLESSQKGKAKSFTKITRLVKSHLGIIYMGSIGVLTILIVKFAIDYAMNFQGANYLYFAIIAGVAVIIPASEIAISIVNWLVCKVKKPAVFPRLELKEGIPDIMSTMVVIPALLTDEKRVKELLENMENHYLANSEENLYFALIGAYKDSEGPDNNDDQNVLLEAFWGIKALNLKYAKEEKDIFYFYHRIRKFNESDNNWTGWERKRGALMEFNEMLLGSQDTSFSFYSNVLLPTTNIKYIITLDADTVLPLGMAKKMIGTMAHPLNIPVIDSNKGIVIEGHGLMQPKISFDIDSSNRSIFSRIYTGQEGIDTYASAISNVYQDLFDEGIFTGKGIYDLKVFQSILKDAVPENAILSHDLLEGSYVRAALVTDLELVDSYPSKYNSFMARLHRWIRGDWQLIPWLSRKIYDRNKNLIKNPLSYISIWKMVDNLRRSLMAPAIMALMFLGFSILPGSSYFWAGFGITSLGLPLAINFWGQVFTGGLKSDKIKRHIPGFFGIKSSLFQFLLSIVFLPYQTIMVLDAIVVTLIRVLITKKNMLVWVTSADAENGQSNSLKSYLSTMGVSSIVGFAIAALAYYFKPESLILSLVFLFVWGIAPFIAYFISIDNNYEKEKLEAEDLLELGKIARKTWRYFEEFANPKNNYLVPDNFQEDPPKGIAYRTSPTNIGLGLLASLSGRDMGYTGILETIDAISKTVTTIEKMEKWNGHLYNWYDTRTLVPLNPLYVSTVDSGNFVCYLTTLVQGLKDYYSSPLVDATFVKGIKDTLRNGLEDGEELPLEFTYFDFIEKEDKINLMLWNKALGELIEGTVFANIKKKQWKAKLARMAMMFKNELKEIAPWVYMTETIPEEMFKDVLAEKTNLLLDILKTNVYLEDLATFSKNILEHIDKLIEDTKKIKGESFKEGLAWLNELREAVIKSNEFSLKFIDQYNQLIERINGLSMNTRFTFLYNERRQLFSIGYNIEEKRLTNSYYDLLASESRQTSYIAIARGEVPPKHWFILGRSLTVVDHYKGLISWSGTMFEYLMPLLIMRSYRNTLLDETYSFVIKSQKKYGKQRGMPWGTSESSFNSLDINLNYQYKAIGVPWLGLKRGLIEDAVTAPYATFMALMVSPYDAFKNIKYLKAEGLDGPYGYYEAADYTPERLSFQSERVIIKSYMAHHQGMSLLALNNYLNKNNMQKRFSNDPFVKAARLLLQEKVPLNVVFTKENKEKIMPFKGMVYRDKGSYRRFTTPDNNLPKAHILSNGNYSVMTTDKGTGYSRSKTVAISRWREDPIIDSYGMFFYIKNIDKNQNWSAAYAPLNVLPENYEVVFTSDKAAFKRTDGEIETSTEIVVASGDNAEIRRVRLKNNGKIPCILEVTSYFEVVLASQNSDLAHPAFSNLFVRTEFNPEYKALLANRRPRGQTDKEMWIAEIPVIDGEIVGDIQFETDRMQFIGRGHTVNNPTIVERDKPLSNTVGPVLDPIFSLRVRVKIEPGKAAKISFVTTMADNKESIMELIEKYSNIETCDASFWLALTRSQVETKYLNIKAPEMELYQEMISNILFISPQRLRYEQLIKENRKGQSSLWPYGISGDRPIILVTLNRTEEVEILYEVLKAHEYWRLKDLKVDLVILSQEENSYTNPLFSLITDIVYSSQTHDVLNLRGDVFILNTFNMLSEDINLFCAVARMIFNGSDGTMEEQLKTLPQKELPALLGVAPETSKDVLNLQNAWDEPKELLPPLGHIIGEEKDLLYFNGLGGFGSDGREYVIKLEKGQMTPAPWVNVIANPEFGFMVSESGGGFSWCENSRENKLSPWSNDPVSDNQGEMFYLRDESAEIWSITPLPIREEEAYTIKHGFGYTEFEHVSHGISQALVQFVPVQGTVKISIISLCNESQNDRNLSITYYLSPVLGVNTGDTDMHITSLSNKGTLIVENPYNTEFADRVCFMDTSIEERCVTGDRKEFFGLGKADSPECLKRKNLSGAVGVGYDPCAAMQVNISIKANETKELVFILGMAGDLEKAHEFVDKFKNVETAKESLKEVKKFWQEKLQVVQVTTPDPDMNIMLNGWLLYQVISCRLWARSAFYQAGGAFGFRDQLQDCLSIAAMWPQIAKNQIIKHAQHQFVEGDVLHWWHEPVGKGTRTRISDDFLWLPYVTAEYIKITGDSDILKSEIPFLEDDILKDYEDERYCHPRISKETASLFDHCIRSLENALKFGERGLPLIGGGDWNDGMNTVGNCGKGESVWLGWFLCTTLQKFIPICRQMGDNERANKYFEISGKVVDAIEKNGWDGNWYKRAFFDNGVSLGSANNSECKIDSLAQTWAVISGEGDATRATKAMGSLEDYLIMHEEGLIKLLTPPFNDGDMEPGYIKGYVPGVRENGGQYTHAAAWVIIAFAKLGDGDKARELFELINPINHTRTNREYSIYKVEPYVMAADVYGEHPHIGRGGWTWYTGSASWMYKAGLENILGFSKNGDKLVIDPCIPKKWTEYSIKYNYLETTYDIKVRNPESLSKGVSNISIDGEILNGNVINLTNDKITHYIEILMGSSEVAFLQI